MPYDYGQNYGGQGSRTTDWRTYQQLRQGDRTGRTGEDFARGLLGGPAGWYEVGSGNSIGGISSGIFSGTTLNDAMTEDVYNSMSPEEWQAFAHMSNQQQMEFIHNRAREVGAGRVQAQAGQRTANDAAAKEAQFQQWRKGQMDKLQAFADEMGMSVDELAKRGDLGLQNVTNQGNRVASAQAYGAGLSGGGISALNNQKAVADAQAQYQMQRNQLGLQARGQLLDQLGGLAHEREDMRRYEQGMDMNMQQAQAAAMQQRYQQGLAQSGGMLGLVGGVAGAYFGKSPEAAQAGYQLGSGLGQQQYANQNPYSPYRYRYPSGGGRSSGYGLGGGQ